MRKLIYIIWLVLALPALGEEVVSVNRDDDGKTRVELGAALGFPALFNASAAVWFEDGFVTRVSGFPWYFVNGVQVDVGLSTLREAHSRQFVALSAGHIQMSGTLGRETLNFVGPKYEFNFDGIFFDIGLAYAWGQGKGRATGEEFRRRSLFLPQFQIGFSPAFF